jgi:hypothetical protein
MPRSWDTNKDAEARSNGDDMPNVDALQGAIDRLPHWTVSDLLQEIPGRNATNILAQQILRERGVEITKTNISSQMRSINRWMNYEAGTGKQARKPSKEMQAILNKLGRNTQMAQDGFTVAMAGDIEVAGYRRSDRTASVHMQGAAAAKWLDNPTFEAMAQFYEGNQIAAFGDVQVDII